MNTRKQISKAIFEETGLNVSIGGNSGVGCFHFYSDDEETGIMLAKFYDSSVYINSLSQLSVERCVSEFKDKLEEFNKYN